MSRKDRSLETKSRFMVARPGGREERGATAHGPGDSLQVKNTFWKKKCLHDVVKSTECHRIAHFQMVCVM